MKHLSIIFILSIASCGAVEDLQSIHDNGETAMETIERNVQEQIDREKENLEKGVEKVKDCVEGVNEGCKTVKDSLEEIEDFIKYL